MAAKKTTAKPKMAFYWASSCGMRDYITELGMRLVDVAR